MFTYNPWISIKIHSCYKVDDLRWTLITFYAFTVTSTNDLWGRHVTDVILQVGYEIAHWPSLKVLPWYISTTTSMVTTFTFSGRHRQPSRLYNSLGVSDPKSFKPLFLWEYDNLSTNEVTGMYTRNSLIHCNLSVSTWFTVIHSL